MAYKAFGFLFLTLFVLIACQQDFKLSSGDLDFYQIGAPLKKESFLSNIEKQKAQKLCRLLKSKRLQYTAVRGPLGSVFEFSWSSQTCGGDKTEKIFKTTLGWDEGRETLIFKSSFPYDFLKTIPTEQEGPLSPLCREIFSGKEKVSNTYLYGKEIKIQLHFAKNSNYFVIYAHQDFNDKGGVVYYTHMMEKFELAEANPNLLFPGQILSLTRYFDKCPDSEQFFTQKQVFLKKLSPRLPSSK